MINLLEKTVNLIDKGLEKQKPNYFRLGYYILKNPEFDFTSIPVDELNNLTRKYLDENYMNEFIELGSTGILHSHEKSIERKQQL